MKQIGKSVLFLAAKEGNPRNGESTFLRLKDGRIMFAYTEYYGDSWADHATAHLCACTSTDEGETWTAPRVIVEKDERALNIMSPSLVRMNNGDLGILYLRKEKMPDTGQICMPTFRRSTDEGETWSDAQTCGAPDGYYCGINDGAVVLRSGRILYPMSYHGLRYDAYGTCTLDLSMQKNSDVRFIYSDDDGATWGVLPSVLKTPYDDRYGLAEPGVYEHEDGTLWCWFRTLYGFQYHSHSADGGVSWDPVEPNFCFTSPESPMRVKRVGPYVAAVFNPIAISCLRENIEIWGRTPIVCALSADDGHSFSDRGIGGISGGRQEFAEHCFLLETDRRNGYCYPSIQETKDGFLVSYYHSNGTPVCLNSSKIVKVRFNEI